MRSFRVAICGTKLERVAARVLITLGSRTRLVLTAGAICGCCSSLETSIMVDSVVLVLLLVETLLVFWVEWLSILLLVGLISLSEITSSSTSEVDFERVRSIELDGLVGSLFWDGMEWVEGGVIVVIVGLVCMQRRLGFG